MKVAYHGQQQQIKGPMCVRELILAAGLDPDLVFAVCGGKVLKLDDVVADETEVELMDAMAGG
jgi:sulfur carrier protein ThiS